MKFGNPECDKCGRRYNIGDGCECWEIEPRTTLSDGTQIYPEHRRYGTARFMATLLWMLVSLRDALVSRMTEGQMFRACFMVFVAIGALGLLWSVTGKPMLKNYAECGTVFLCAYQNRSRQ